MTGRRTRSETDALGSIEVAADRYWGAHTQRVLENFAIGHARFPTSVIRAFGIVKKACARTNARLGRLSPEKAELIVRAATEVSEGRLDDHFPLLVWQSGSGTPSNMNANEVIANRANELAGGTLGSKTPIHPNDDVNASQSSNDVFPTVMHVAAAIELRRRLLPSLLVLRHALESKADAFAGITKIGRTHLMDAMPLTLGQEFGGYAAALAFAESCVHDTLPPLHELALGGTAVGTGFGTPTGWSEAVAAEIATLTGLPFSTAKNKFMGLAGHEPIAAASSALRTVAIACFKIASDIRLLASGPRAGLGELILPPNEAGSSIMPGKVNPTQCEALTMVVAQVMGNDAAIGFAASQGHLELNAFKPVLIHNLLESIRLLADAMSSFDKHCVVGLQPNRSTIARHLARSLLQVTTLSKVVGYDAATRIAAEAEARDLTLAEAAAALGILTEAEFALRVR